MTSTALALHLLALPPVRRGPQDGIHDLLAQHGTLLYVALAILVLGLVAIAVVASGQAEDADRRRDRRLKQETLGLVRLRATLTPEQVAAEKQIDVLHAARLLAELEAEGLVVSSGRQPVQYRRVGSGARRND